MDKKTSIYDQGAVAYHEGACWSEPPEDLSWGEQLAWQAGFDAELENDMGIPAEDDFFDE